MPTAKKQRRTKPNPALIARAKKIRVLLMDVDGVLTDGRIWLLSAGMARRAKSKASARMTERD